MDSKDAVDADRLSTIGARIQFIVQRLVYLRQHPDATPGRDFVWDNDAASSTALLTGALFDLFLDVFGGDLPKDEDLQAPLTDTGVEIRLTIRRDPDESGAGFQLVKRLASSVLLSREKGHLLVVVTGASIEAGFPPRIGTGCLPAIAG